MAVGGYFLRPPQPAKVDDSIAQARILKLLGARSDAKELVMVRELAAETGFPPDDLERYLRGLEQKEMIESRQDDQERVRLTSWGYKAQFLVAS